MILSSCTLSNIITPNLYKTGKFRTLLIRRKKSCYSPRRDVIKSLCRSKRVCLDSSGFVTADDRSEAENTKILRNHFSVMMNAFLKPFEKYFVRSSVVPVFRSSKFLKDDLSGAITSPEFKMMKREDYVELYRRFLIGRTFKMWFLSVRKSVYG